MERVTVLLAVSALLASALVVSVQGRHAMRADPPIEQVRPEPLPAFDDMAPMLHLTFDGDTPEVQDHSGRGHQARVVGGAIRVPSPDGEAVRLSNSKMWVQADGPDIHGWEALTVAARVRMLRLTTYGSVVSFYGVTGAKTRGLHLQLGGSQSVGAFNLAVGDGVSTVHHPETARRHTAVQVGEWVDVVATFDGVLSRLYLDREIVESSPVPVAGSIETSPGNVWLIGKCGGHRFGWLDSYLHGDIDTFMVWDRALTAEQVAGLDLGGNAPL